MKLSPVLGFIISIFNWILIQLTRKYYVRKNCKYIPVVIKIKGKKFNLWKVDIYYDTMIIYSINNVYMIENIRKKTRIMESMRDSRILVAWKIVKMRRSLMPWKQIEIVSTGPSTTTPSTIPRANKSNTDIRHKKFVISSYL
jgi:hypothetical protein